MDVSVRKISYKQLPKKALAAISKRERSCIDEFEFREYKDGHIEAWYAGEFVGVWWGPSAKRWEVVGYG